ncbi:uncharacterized protein LOC111023620 [Momordica charantia]|uniref:Uncharacterized protein LOC111023620 n=1 Tax=Momordica charantia TaxID=3673 RepID=A0A6J1DW11_MOMCH|nr:uncharacterized protein LOC111023620 [Momordica charantia]
MHESQQDDEESHVQEQEGASGLVDVPNEALEESSSSSSKGKSPSLSSLNVSDPNFVAIAYTSEEKVCLTKVVKKARNKKNLDEIVPGANSRPCTRATIASLAAQKEAEAGPFKKAKRVKGLRRSEEPLDEVNDEELDSIEQTPSKAKRVRWEVKRVNFTAREILVEKGFDEAQEPVPKYIKRRLLENGWETLFAPTMRVSETLVKEFYATINPNRGDALVFRVCDWSTFEDKSVF